MKSGFFIRIILQEIANIRQQTVIKWVIISCGFFSYTFGQDRFFPVVDTTVIESEVYDPFGPENSPDYIGQGSGGALTSSPYDNNMQTYYTRMNADYYGIQYMLDSPLQLSIGTGWSAYQVNEMGLMVKARTVGIRKTKYDPIREEDVPYYLSSIEVSAERIFRENRIRAFKIRVNGVTELRDLSMAGVGVLFSKWNLLVAGDRSMDRKLEIEATWIQVTGGYLMPLSPKKGGVNIAICCGVNLFGLKYQLYYSDQGKFLGAKVGSIGWLAGVGWNANTFVNLTGYVGGDWSFSTGGLRLPIGEIVRADIARNTLCVGIQASSRWFNVTGGIQKEWEYIDYQKTVNSEKGLHYYVGLSAYFSR